MLEKQKTCYETVIYLSYIELLNAKDYWLSSNQLSYSLIT